MALTPACASRTSRSTASSSARARTRGSRTCAPPRGPARLHGAASSVRAPVVPGSQTVKREAEREGLDRIFGRRRRVARAGLLDVPRHEPRTRSVPASGARRRAAATSRGARARRPHALGQPGDGRRGGRRRPLRRRPAVGVPVMEPFTIHRGLVAPLLRDDVDTDQIIPKQFLKRIERDGFGQFLFDDWRREPGFALESPRYRGASILVAGAKLRLRLVARARAVGRHEQGGGSPMAEGYARSTGKPGVARHQRPGRHQLRHRPRRRQDGLVADRRHHRPGATRRHRHRRLPGDAHHRDLPADHQAPLPGDATEDIPPRVKEAFHLARPAGRGR